MGKLKSFNFFIEIISSFSILYNDEKIIKNGDIIKAGDAIFKVRYFSVKIMGF